mgnify:CR=1 FL=1
MDKLPSWVEVDLDALAWNILQVRSLVPAGVRVLLVVKADAYGHGAVRVSRHAAECGVDMLGVATLDEGRELRKAGIGLPILILSPVLEQELEEAIGEDLAVSVSSVDFAAAASAAALRTGGRCRMHIEVDTGMGRAGLAASEAAGAIREIARMERLDLEGIFTHFPSSDSDPDFSSGQIDEFASIVEALADDGIEFEYVHAANSAALVNFPRSRFNMVRPGILVYGYSPSLALMERIDPLPVMSFRSRLLLVREIPAGTGISYGRTFIAPKDMRIGVIGAGYGHGLSHRLSNRGSVLYGGTRVPVIGRVTMDMTMIDLTRFPRAGAGDEVVLFGRQGDAEISVDDMASWEGSLNYEVLCRISKRVVRVYMKSGRVESLKTLLGVHERA